MPDITLKIHQGTGRLTGESMCRSCDHGSRWTDSQGEHVECQFNSHRRIRGKVLDCNDYYSATLPSMSDMKELAWVLRPGSGRAAGFQPPQKKLAVKVD